MRDGNLDPGERLEEVVVPVLVHVRVARLATHQELALLIVEVVPEDIPVVIEEVHVGGIVAKFVEGIKQNYVLFVQPRVLKKGFFHH